MDLYLSDEFVAYRLIASYESFAMSLPGSRQVPCIFFILVLLKFATVAAAVVAQAYVYLYVSMPVYAYVRAYNTPHFFGCFR